MHRSRTRFVAGLAAAALPLAFLAGCGEDEPEPKFEDPTSESPSASSTSDEPEKPTPPAAMKGDDVEGAKAFVEYYFAVLDYASMTGDLAGFKELGLSDCGACNGAARAIRAIHKKGGTVTGGTTRVDSLSVKPGQPIGENVRPFEGQTVLQVRQRTVEGTGDSRLDGTSQASSIKLRLHFVHDRTGWSMAEWIQP